MTTLRQAEANRRNSKRSTGPKSRRLQPGIRAAVLPAEDRRAYNALVALYYTRFHPNRPEERVFVDQIIHCEWTLRRLIRTETELTAFVHQSCTYANSDFPVGQPTGVNPKLFSALQWRLNTTRKAGKQALAALRRLRENPIPTK